VRDLGGATGLELTESVLGDSFVLSVLRQFRPDVDDEDGHPAFFALMCDRRHGESGAGVDLLHGLAWSVDATLPDLIEVALRHEQDEHGWLV
jgi:hypothetical protein